ncbi:formate dehydrogenase accessory sulfurtransferase FdhD [Microvirga guangxiensis]|uniref:Sulfur carrier protein FdhD n=1 Tax=Microvirga guangxiensis TaxID=549386 RepID=A0A1G5EZQ0_9HYPH|nr:formate dehydrogenase accessory sulfurtransferase FdhD [Microvirga guangxiensis]SCY32321.1 FdhD protein [Microvirga guangxiensis]
MSLNLSPIVRMPQVKVGREAFAPGERVVAEEMPIAMTYNGSTHAVMMASPADLEDFALGFSLSEGVIAAPDDLVSTEIIEHETGCEIRMWLSERRSASYQMRRRALAGPIGCGLCGVESLAEVERPLPSITSELQVSPEAIAGAMENLSDAQRLNREARAIHAAAFWRPEQGVVAIREDVGRHNALDKLAGALAARSEICSDGAVLLTSRVSVEMVQKTARMGAPLLIAISAPTALAIRAAEGCGITLLAVARGDSFEVFTHPQRVALTQP